MKTGMALTSAILLSGCVSAGPAPAPWLAGLWLGLDEGLEYPLACASGAVIRYYPNGRYALVEEEGTWRLDGERLTETTTELTGAGDGEPAELNRPYVSRIRREGPDLFLKTYADGEQMRFRRCPEE